MHAFSFLRRTGPILEFVGSGLIHDSKPVKPSLEQGQGTEDRRLSRRAVRSPT